MFDILNAYSGAYLAKAETKANNRVSAATTEANNRVRGSGNAFSAAKGALSRYMQSVNNNEALEAGGQVLEANLINARRQDDQLSEASFEEQIRVAEQLGAQSAAAAFAGIGGEVADSISISTRLMHQRAERQAAAARLTARYDSSRRASIIAQQTVRGLDQSLILDSLDYSTDVAQTRQAGSVGWAVAGAIYKTAQQAVGLATGMGGMGGAAQAGFSQTSAGASGFGTGLAYGNKDYGSFI